MTAWDATTAVGRINPALDAVMFPPPDRLHALRGTTLHMCRATLAEWNEYVQSEDAMTSARYMAWFGPETDNSQATGEIRIVEWSAGATHDVFAFVLSFAISTDPAVRPYMRCSLGTANTRGPQLRPDASFGPKESAKRPLGVQLPQDVPSWYEFVTIKVEIGVSQDWGETPGSLDWKAQQWAKVPGVAYVLFILVDEDVEAAWYKSYDVAITGERPPYQPNATAVVFPFTTVQMDARRVLGLGPSDTVPAGFLDPFFLDLYAVLQSVRAQF